MGKNNIPSGDNLSLPSLDSIPAISAEESATLSTRTKISLSPLQYREFLVWQGAHRGVLYTEFFNCKGGERDTPEGDENKNARSNFRIALENARREHVATEGFPCKVHNRKLGVVVEVKSEKDLIEKVVKAEKRGNRK